MNVKKCVSCAKDIPDTAFHCVFCGAKQGAPQTAGPAQRTIMGYAAADLQKLLPNQQGGAAQGGYVPSGSDQRTMMAGVGGAPIPGSPAEQRTMMAGVGGAPMPPSAAEQRTMMAGVGGAPMPPSPAEQRTMMAGVGGAPLPPMQQQPQPYQPQSYQPQPQPYQPQSYQPQPVVAPMSAGFAAQRPQYLASQSAARDMAPTEPWAGSLRGMMIFFGIVLVATVALPQTLSPLTFMWQILTTGAPIQAKLWPLVLAAGGLLALLFGLLPVPTSARGIVAAIVGILPFVVMMIVGSPAGGSAGVPLNGWQGYALIAGIILAPTGLLVRSQYRSSGLGRILTLIGCGAIIALYVIPQGGTLPVVGLLKSMSGGIAAVLPTVWMLVLLGAAGLGLLMSLMPSSTSGGTGMFAWIIMAWFFGMMLLAMVIAPIIGGGGLPGMVKSPAGIAFLLDFLAWPVLAAYGLATTFGKSLEA